MDASEPTGGGPPEIAPEVYRTLTAIEDLVDEPTQRFGRALSLSQDEFLALTQRLRKELPSVLRKADDAVARLRETLDAGRKQADDIAREARDETDRIVQEAHRRAAQLVDESPEVQFAAAQARDIVAQAQQTANNARQDADEYARELLTHLRDYVQQIHHQVRSGLVALDRDRDAK